MDEERFFLQSQSVEIAETLANGNIRAKFVICDFGVNKNGLQVNKDKIINWYQSIVNQPLVGRVKNGDFTSHNLKLIPYIDEAGEVQKRIELDTDAFGTFVSAGIEKVNGVECLVATAEIWSRFTRAFNVVKQRIENGTLFSSFEIKVNDYRVADGVKIVDDAVFTAHCCLGKNVAPAYDTSRLLEVAEYDESIYEALAEDIAEHNKTIGDETVENERIDETLLAEDETEEPTGGETPEGDAPSGDNSGSETPEGGEGSGGGEGGGTDDNTGSGEGGSGDGDDSGNTGSGNTDPSAGGGGGDPEVDPKTLDDESDDGAGTPVGVPAKKADTASAEVAAIEAGDLYRKLNKACRRLFVDEYSFIEFIFPEDRECWVHKEDDDRLTYYKITYTVVNDKITISEPEKVTLIVQPQEVNDAIAQRDAALATANDTINALKAEIASLSIYKEQIEKAEAERIESENKVRREALKTYALNSKFISKDEIETSEEIKQMISNVDENGIKQIIGQRFMESLETNKPVETASAEPAAVPRTLVDEDSYAGSIVSAFIHKK